MISHDRVNPLIENCPTITLVPVNYITHNNSISHFRAQMNISLPIGKKKISHYLDIRCIKYNCSTRAISNHHVIFKNNIGHKLTITSGRHIRRNTWTRIIYKF